MQMSNMWNVAKCETEPLHSQLTQYRIHNIQFDVYMYGVEYKNK